MNLSIKTFVYQYRDILQTYKDNPRTKPSWLTLVPLMILMGLISLAMGWLLQVHSNLNYVWYMTNTIVLGSFLMYRIKQELRYKETYQLTYNHWVVIGMNALTLATILFVSNTILILLLFRTILSVFDVFFISTLAIILITLHTIISQTGPMYKYIPRVLRYVFVIVPLYVVILTLLSGITVSFGYVLSTTIIAILAIVEYKLPKELYESGITTRIVMILASVWGFLFIIDTDRVWTPVDGVYTSRLNIAEKVEFQVDTPTVLATSTNYYIYREDHFNEYDLHLEFEKKVPTFMDGSVSIQLDKLAFTKVVDEVSYQSKLNVYQPYEDNFETYLYQDVCYNPSDFFYFERELALACGSSILKFPVLTETGEADTVRINELPEEMTIAYEDLNRVVIYFDTIVYIDQSESRDIDGSTYFYDNGYLLVHAYDSYYDLYRLRDFMYGDEPLATFDETYGSIEEMHVIDDIVYIQTYDYATSSDHLVTYKTSGRLQSVFYQTEDYNFIFTNTDILMVADNGQDVWFLDLEQPGTTILESGLSTFRLIRLWSLFGMMATLLLVSNKGGEA